VKAKRYNKKKRADEESTGELRNNSENDCKNVPEQKAMTVYIEGYEEAFEDRPNVEPAFVVKNLLKRPTDVTQERDSLSNQVQVLKEKTQPELLKELPYQVISENHRIEMSQEDLTYDQLLSQARGTAKYWIPRLCGALRSENPNYSNYNIKEIVMKDCIEIWQKATIRDALPDEYKDKLRQELGREGNKVRYGSEQATEFADSGESCGNQRDSNLAKSSSFDPIEDVSEDFDRMNRGQDVITESEKIKKLGERITQVEEEKEMIRVENHTLKEENHTLKEENHTLKEENHILKEKTQPELLKELQEKFYDEPGLLDAKKLQKISMEAGKNLMILAERYNSILQEAVERGKPVPFGTYILTKPELKLVPIRIMVDFDRKRIRVELWEKRLQRLSR
jgi:hypothetical protein